MRVALSISCPKFNLNAPLAAADNSFFRSRAFRIETLCWRETEYPERG